MKQKRSKWTHQRARELEHLRITTPLTYEALGKREGMTAQSVKASIQRWLKRGATQPTTPPVIKEFETAFFDKQKAEEILSHHKRMAKAWATILGHV